MKSSRIKILLLLAVAGGIIGGIIGWKIYHKPHKDLAHSKAAYELSANALYSAFETEEQAATEKYRDKIIVVKGTVESIDLNNTAPALLLSGSDAGPGSIKCGIDPEFVADFQSLQTGANVSLKCIFSGVNKLEEMGIVMLDLELSRCIVAN